MVADRARPYASSRPPADLIRLRPGVSVGTWRDSADGLGGGHVPYDVNVALVPTAIDAEARLWATTPVGPDPVRAADARALASAWTGTARHFDVAIDGSTARDQVANDVVARELRDAHVALDTIGDGIRFPASPLTHPCIRYR